MFSTHSDSKSHLLRSPPKSFSSSFLQLCGINTLPDDQIPPLPLSNTPPNPKISIRRLVQKSSQISQYRSTDKYSSRKMEQDRYQQRIDFTSRTVINQNYTNRESLHFGEVNNFRSNNVLIQDYGLPNKSSQPQFQVRSPRKQIFHEEIEEPYLKQNFNKLKSNISIIAKPVFTSKIEATTTITSSKQMEPFTSFGPKGLSAFRNSFKNQLQQSQSQFQKGNSLQRQDSLTFGCQSPHIPKLNLKSKPTLKHPQNNQKQMHSAELKANKIKKGELMNSARRTSTMNLDMQEQSKQSIVIQDFNSLMEKVKQNKLDNWEDAEDYIKI